MSALKAFQVAAELAERQRDAARQALLDVQAAQRAAQAQLAQLTGYAGELQGRWGMRADSVVQPEVMRHYYQFTGRLEQAMAMQANTLAGQDTRVAQARQVLLQAELRLASLAKVLERRRAELALQQQRQEQKHTDERAALRAGRARAGVLNQEN
ncbi:MAG: flagellar export protein FliJ [Comamonadaceae bacterium]|nr:flagellar export protein FliJ [Pseudomonadota bacterium]MDE2414269.1 flagellar export protein FliJ [Comamonadaceae bacterium]